MLTLPNLIPSGVQPLVEIDPVLTRWIAENARAGVDPGAVVAAMRQAGWAESDAAKVMQDVVVQVFPGFSRNPFVSTVHAHPIPEPLMDSGSSYVYAGDKMVEVVMTSMLPRLVVFDGFLSDDECEGLIELARPRMERSGVIQPVTGGSEINDVRTSTGMFFQLGEQELVARIESRIACMLHWPVENGEGIQVLNYQQNAEYKPHQDFFDPADVGTPKSIGLAGQRVGTLLMYLNTPERGGGTVFPDAGLEVHAKKGRAVLFTYDQPSPMKKTLHGGAPVLQGEKWAATKWMRQRAFIPQGIPGPRR